MGKNTQVKAAGIRALNIIALAIGMCVATGHLQAQVTLTNIYSFGPLPGTKGYNPAARLVRGVDGSFYGTAYLGGGLYGTVFRVSPTGIYTNLHTFTGTFGTGDGEHPAAPLLRASDGNFYGTTIAGGVGGNGSIFRISPTGTFLNIYSFVSGTSGPRCGLVQGKDGNLYGTTYGGAGCVFRIGTSGTGFTNLHSFGGTDGFGPRAGLVQGSDGAFYGTTETGGSVGWNRGSVFRITTNGTFTSLYSFSGPDGQNPYSSLVEGRDGNLYGTTRLGGTNGSGSVFRISPGGVFTNLYSFGANSLGGAPQAGLMIGSDGAFYGMAFGGGTNNLGTVFSLSTNGTYTLLHVFTGKPGDGSNPTDTLVQGSDGAFYGTTQNGGTNDLGSIFRMTVPLAVPANHIGSMKVVGTNAVVTVQSVASETYQLQYNGTLDPGGWSNAPGASAVGIGGPVVITNSGGFTQTRKFYRFSIVP